MKHPDEQLLQCYLDGELPAPLAREVQAHLDICPPCCTQARAGVAIIRAVRSLCPDARAFIAHDEFWGRLRSALAGAPLCPWTWLALLPPAVLGLVATGLRALLGLLGVGYVLQAAGVIAPMGSGVADSVADALVLPEVQYAAYFVGGWSTGQMQREVVTLWSQLEQLTHKSAGFWFLVIPLDIALSIVSVLYVGWVLFYLQGVRAGRGG
ncbi:MAG: zf-HC2 domain-containing protein [Chloroflexota bacterium]